MKKLIAILFALVFVSSLVQAQDTAGLKKKIQAMNDEGAMKMISGDESMWDNYADDIISMPSYEPMLKGIEACKESYQKMSEAGMKITAFKSTSTDVMHSGNLIVDIGTYEITMTIPEMGDMPYTDHGKYMTIWEMQDDGSLKVKAETWNSDINPWEEMKMMQGETEGHEGHQH
jgi:ketosteroid isomerase-like protein